MLEIKDFICLNNEREYRRAGSKVKPMSQPVFFVLHVFDYAIHLIEEIIIKGEVFFVRKYF